MEPLEVDFPYARALIVVRCTRTVSRTATTSHEVRYYLSSAEPAAHTPTQWLALIQGHWAGVRFVTKLAATTCSSSMCPYCRTSDLPEN